VVRSAVPRRRFLKYFFTGAVTSSVAGRLVRSPVLWAAEPTLPQTPGFVRLNVDDYSNLADELGSIRVSLNPIFGGGEPYPAGFFYPIMITRLPDDPQQTPVKRFIALDCECRHQGCVVEAFNGSYCECACHGSQYDMLGGVLSGPTEEPLRVLNHTFDGVNRMTIEVPHLGYHAVPERADGERLKLSFFAFPLVTYRILTRPGFGPGTDWTPVSFSQTPGGSLTETEYLGQSLAVSLYVEAAGQAAYFVIEADLLEL